MVKLAIYYEQDDDNKDTGRVQVVDEDDAIVLDTFNTDEEAEAAMVKIQAEYDRDAKITAEYLEWEKGCLARHEISQDDLRIHLVNVVII